MYNNKNIEESMKHTGDTSEVFWTLGYIYWKNIVLFFGLMVPAWEKQSYGSSYLYFLNDA